MKQRMSRSVIQRRHEECLMSGMTEKQAQARIGYLVLRVYGLSPKGKHRSVRAKDLER